MEIAKVVELFDAIAPAHEQAWNIEPLVEGRLYLSKSSDKKPALFLEGTSESFGPLPLLSTIQHSRDVVALPSKRNFEALRITAKDSANDCRVLAHIAYELAWRIEQKPEILNQDLIGQVTWLFSLLGGDRLPMSSEKQLGLVGELLFLRRLLQRAHTKSVHVLDALKCWTGAEQAKRDFYGSKTAVEAKATAHVARLHHIGSIDQLTPQEDDEALYLFSVGIRLDPTAPKKMTNYVADIESLLIDKNGKADEIAVGQFRQRISTSGFDWADRDLYERQAGFLAPHLTPELFAVSKLNRLSLDHFIEGKIPETVRSISYVLEITALPLDQSEAAKVLDRMLGL